MSNQNLDGQNIVITGANRGIGLALVKHYQQRKAQVYALCRKTSDDLNTTDAIVIEGVDVSSAEAMEKVQRELDGVSVSVLINNAGVLESETLTTMNFDNIKRQFEINALGPLRVTSALLPNFVSGAKVGLITSRMGSIADNGSGGYYGYRMSKAALNAAGKSLANDLKPNGIAVAILHPGFVQTEMVGYAGDISAEAAAARLAERLDDLTLANSGSFWHSSGEELPW